MTTIVITDWAEFPASLHEIEIEGDFRGFSYDGGRLDITGYYKTIWVFSQQFSVTVKEEE